MKKNQKIILGISAIVVVCLFIYNKNKSQKNRNGYSNSTGRVALNNLGGLYGLGCKVCEDSQTKQTYFSNKGECKQGDSCVVSVRPTK